MSAQKFEELKTKILAGETVLRSDMAGLSVEHIDELLRLRDENYAILDDSHSPYEHLPPTDS